MRRNHESERPPELPVPEPKIRLYRYQWIGLAILAAAPLLAVAGAFGESHREIRTSGAAIDISVRYPTRMRYKQVGTIDIVLLRDSRFPADSASVSLDTTFASRFSDVHALPAFTSPFRANVKMGERGSGQITLQLQAERYGVHEGALSVAVPGDTTRIPLRVRVFP